MAVPLSQTHWVSWRGLVRAAKTRARGPKCGTATDTVKAHCQIWSTLMVKTRESTYMVEHWQVNPSDTQKAGWKIFRAKHVVPLTYVLDYVWLHVVSIWSWFHIPHRPAATTLGSSPSTMITPGQPTWETFVALWGPSEGAWGYLCLAMRVLCV